MRRFDIGLAALTGAILTSEKDPVRRHFKASSSAWASPSRMLPMTISLL